jgi:hypothetical protein
MSELYLSLKVVPTARLRNKSAEGRRNSISVHFRIESSRLWFDSTALVSTRSSMAFIPTELNKRLSAIYAPLLNMRGPSVCSNFPTMEFLSISSWMLFLVLESNMTEGDYGEQQILWG